VKAYKKGICVPTITKAPGDFDGAEYNLAALLEDKAQKEVSMHRLTKSSIIMFS